jgi:hypothetical protein
MPEISPELAARIEQLRSSHRENPARFFMPLASAYREAGELGQAEELLRENLKRHPGYLSAHVLLGRCLADRGALGEARNEFSYVLSIDPQNLIALRTLGEMAAANGNADEARRWYGELLSVDPMNAEARQALDALESAPPAPVAAQAEGGWDPFAHGDVAPEDAPAAEETSFGGGAQETSFAPMEEELMDAPSFRPLEPAPELGFGAVDLPPPANDDFASWGDVSLDAPSGPPAADLPAAPEAADAMDFGAVELTDDWNSTPEPLAADATAGWGMFDDAPATGDEIPAEPLPELRSFHDEDAAEDDVEMVTETMAELYYRQGFVDRAADVYRELIARRGEEPALTRRLAELEGELRGGVAETPATEPGFAPEHDSPVFTSEPQQTPSWLEAVDAHMVAGDAQSHADVPEAGLDLPDFAQEEAQSYPDVPEVLPGLDFPAFAQEDAQPFAAEPSYSQAGATGDPFADSFASGFDGSAAFDAPATEPAHAFADERDAWTPPTVEPTAALDFAEEPVSAFEVDQGTTFYAEPAAPDPVHAEPAMGFDAEPAAAEPLFAGSTNAFDAPAHELDVEAAAPEQFYAEPEPSFGEEAPYGAAEPAFAAQEAAYDEPEAPRAEPSFAAAEVVRAEHRASDGTESVASYLWSVLSWRPGQAAAAPAAYAEPEQSASDAQPFALDAEPVVPESLYAEPFIESEAESLGYETAEPAPLHFDPPASEPHPFASTEPAPFGFEAAEPAPHPFASSEPAPSEATGPAADSVFGFEPQPLAAESAEPAPYDFAPRADAGTQQRDAGAPPPPEPWDDQTLGAPEQQPPLDEPWMAAEQAEEPWMPAAEPAQADEPWMVAAEPELTPANDDDEPWAIPAAPTEALLPADDEQGPIDELPWLAAEPEVDAGVLPVDDYAPTGTEAASGTAAGDEPMPWEIGLDLDAPEPAPTPAPAQPVAGFSFEDFFSEQAPAPAAEPPAPPAAAPQPEAAADDDEDLESFQAWLQSLKR